jgi:hypothetical protein
MHFCVVDQNHPLDGFADDCEIHRLAAARGQGHRRGVEVRELHKAARREAIVQGWRTHRLDSDDTDAGL